MSSWWQSQSDAVGLATVRLFEAASIRISNTLRDALVRRPWPALELLENLNPREAEVLRLRFGIGDGKRLTLEQIGRRFKLTRERIRQIESEAFANLRTHNSNGQSLKALYQPTKRTSRR